MIKSESILDYTSLGLKVGLEIHQQLDTEEKLHCHCKNTIKDIDEIKFEFTRYLHPKSDEYGNIDPAAVEQTEANRKYIYKAYSNNCLVELDEGDPFPINPDALDLSLIISKYLNMSFADVIHVMRKIIVDGSSTGGFQRTSFISGCGSINTDSGTCRISSVCLEEDSCTNLETGEDYLIYSLDRLGIPLIEIATEPDIKNPKQAYEVAKNIGMILRSTGKVKRGLGTIRQDVNVSIKEGTRVEIKGVQNLDLIPKLIDEEINRQLNLLNLKKLFIERKVKVRENIIDISFIFEKTKSKIINNSLLNNGVVLSISLENGFGLVGYEIQKERRFGTELAEKAKLFGLSGLFHTDELPNYGITENEINNLRNYLNVESKDALIFVTGLKERAEKALEAIIHRIKQVNLGVPKETRRAIKNGTTSYLRPLPGPSRMYPETDLKPIIIKSEYIENLKLPELIPNKIKRYQLNYNLNKELSERLAYSIYSNKFERLVENIGKIWDDKIITQTILANMFVNIFQDLKRENLFPEKIEFQFIEDLFSELNKKRITKEIIKDILLLKCNNSSLTIFDIEKNLFIDKNENYESIIIKEVEFLIKEKKDFICDKKEYSIGPLMGLLMKKYRGKIDGKTINQILQEKIISFLKSRIGN